MRYIAITAAAVLLGLTGCSADDKPAQEAPPQQMSPDLAVAYVQDEFPGRFPNEEKLRTLFKTSCGVLDAGGSRGAAVGPMLDGGLSAEEASYILDMAVYSTCPKYAVP